MQKSRFISLFFAFIIFISLISCSSRNRKEYLSAEDSFRRAMEKYKKGKYLDASEAFTVITLNFSGNAIVDSAQFYLGECNYRMKQYIVAASEYERLINHYPYSGLVEKSKYQMGMCYFKLSPHYGLDQEYSQKCLDEFQEFTEYYPESTLIPEVLDKILEMRGKIAKKTYKSGELYYKMHDYKSANIYFDKVLESYYDTEYAPKALLKKMESFLKMKQTEQAEMVFQRLKEKYPNSPAAKKADLLKHPVKRHVFLFW